jgi:hypothetical protein
MTVSPPSGPGYPPSQPYKAIVAAILTGLSAILLDLQGRETLEGMGVKEWLIVLLSAIVAGGVTYVVPNPPKAGPRRSV